MTDLLTLTQLRRGAPKGQRTNITEDTVSYVNAVLENDHSVVEFRENIMHYLSVLEDGRFKVTDYILAVKYCSLKLTGSTNVEAYSRTFPDRYQRLVDDEMPSNKINAYVSVYNGGKLVSKIMERSMTPHYVLNMHLYQEALNAQADLMMNARSEKVRSDAANSILTHLKVPEIAKIELDVNFKEDDSIKELRDTTLELVRQQKMMIEGGAKSVKEIAHSRIVREPIDIEVIEVD